MSQIIFEQFKFDLVAGHWTFPNLQAFMVIERHITGDIELGEIYEHPHLYSKSEWVFMQSNPGYLLTSDRLEAILNKIKELEQSC